MRDLFVMAKFLVYGQIPKSTWRNLLQHQTLTWLYGSFVLKFLFLLESYSRFCLWMSLACRYVKYCTKLAKLNGGLSRLHSADEDGVSWLTSYGSWHAYEKKKNTSTVRKILQKSSTQPYVWCPAHRDAITWLLCYATTIGCQSNSASSTSCVWWYNAACTATHRLTWRTWSRRRPLQLSDLGRVQYAHF